MSKFFRTGDDTSSDSSSDEEELYSEEEEEEQQQSSEEDSNEGQDDSDSDSSSDEDGVKKTGASAFLRGAGSDSESDSDDERAKVVKSAKDKRFEELEGIIKAIDNGKKINDWGSISAGTYWAYAKMRIATDSTQNSIRSTARLLSSSRAARPQSLTSKLLPTSRTS